MEIKSTLAQKIVDTLKDVVQHEVNFFDLDSQIIASTNPTRIGTLHNGAFQVLNTREDYVVYEKDDSLGVRPGYNTAVYHKKEIIGVVGITGDPDLVMKYTKIIRKITELIVSENYLMELAYSQRQHQQSLLEYILSDKNILTPSSDLITDHEFDRPRRIVYAEFSYLNNQDLDIYSIIRRSFNKETNLLAVTDKKIFLLTTVSNRDSLENILLSLTKLFEDNYNLSIKFGVSSMISNLDLVKNHKLEAGYAWKWLKSHTLKNIIFYEDLTIERFLITMTHKEMLKYMNQIMGNLSLKEIEEFSKIFAVFEKNNGALQLCSDELFIHKNTLQYRLNKFSETTGYNPRDYSDFVEIKLSLMAYFVLKENNAL